MALSLDEAVAAVRDIVFLVAGQRFDTTTKAASIAGWFTDTILAQDPDVKEVSVDNLMHAPIKNPRVLAAIVKYMNHYQGDEKQFKTVDSPLKSGDLRNCLQVRGPDGKTQVHWDAGFIDGFTDEARAARDEAKDESPFRDLFDLCSAAFYMNIGVLTRLAAAKLGSIVRSAPTVEAIARVLSGPGSADAKSTGPTEAAGAAAGGKKVQYSFLCYAISSIRHVYRRQMDRQKDKTADRHTRDRQSDAMLLVVGCGA